MTKFKVYVTRRVPKPGLDLLLPECDIDFWDSDEAIPQDVLLKNVQGVGALFCMLTDKIDDIFCLTSFSTKFRFYDSCKTNSVSGDLPHPKN
jgi:hypothetical protein